MEAGKCQDGQEFHREFTDEAVKMVIESGRAIAEVAREIHINAGDASHVRVEDAIRTGKNTGVDHLPVGLVRDQPGLVPGAPAWPGTCLRGCGCA
jgi:hypothetical protein